MAALAVSPAAATAVVTAPRLAAPAHAGTRKAVFEAEDLVKLMTTWGDARHSLNLRALRGQPATARRGYDA